MHLLLRGRCRGSAASRGTFCPVSRTPHQESSATLRPASLQNIIKRQRQAIEKIRKENERLKEQLKAESQQNAAATEGNTVSMIAGERCGNTPPRMPAARPKQEQSLLPLALARAVRFD